MKNIKLNFLIVGVLFFLVSCTNQKEDLEPIQIIEVPCEEGCLFTMVEAEGEIFYMSCFEKFAIKSVHPDDETHYIYGFPDNLDEQFKEEGKTVTFSAAFRENTLVPIFPDPSFNMGDIYQTEIVSIK